MTACSVLLAHDADMACRDNRDSFAYDSEGERWSVYHAGGPHHLATCPRLCIYVCMYIGIGYRVR